MKKIFILPILIVPIMAHATDPIGPAHVNSGAVVATASAPYATATEQTGDTTTVVSASYVKGAYNDAIAAVNKVNADKQDKLKNGSNNHNIESKVVGGSNVGGYINNVLSVGVDTQSFNVAKLDIAQDMGIQNLDDALVSADLFLGGIQSLGYGKQESVRKTDDVQMIGLAISVDNLSGASFVNNYNTFHSSMNTLSEGELDNSFMSADGVITLVKTAVDEVQGINDSKRVRAVTAWGDDSTTSLIQFANAQ